MHFKEYKKIEGVLFPVDMLVNINEPKSNPSLLHHMKASNIRVNDISKEEIMLDPALELTGK